MTQTTLFDQDEERRDIPGFESRYAATRDGKIWSHVRKHYLTPFKTSVGYLAVGLADDPTQQQRNRSVHRLVALAWLANPRNYPEVNHINGDRTDNRVENLEWCTHGQNMRNVVERKGPPSDYWQSIINLRQDQRLFEDFQKAFAAYCDQLPPNNTANQSRKLWHFADYRRNVADHYTTRAQIRASVEELRKNR